MAAYYLLIERAMNSLCEHVTRNDRVIFSITIFFQKAVVTRSKMLLYWQPTIQIIFKCMNQRKSLVLPLYELRQFSHKIYSHVTHHG